MWKKIFVLLPVFYCSASFAESPIQYDVSAGFTRDDNITRAELDTDIVEDDVLRIGGSARYKLAINDISYASFRASLDISQYQDWDGLSSNDIGLQAVYHIKPSAGYTAIRYFVLAAYTERMVDNEQREGSVIDLRLGLSKRLTDRISFSAGIAMETVSANDAVFEQDNTEIYVDFDYRLTENNMLYASISSIDGDIASTAQPNADIIAASQVISADSAFAALPGNNIAYKLAADTVAFKLGDSYSIDSMQALDLSVLYYDASTYLSNDYSGTIIDLAYIYRF